MTITASTNLNKGDIERMVQQAASTRPKTASAVSWSKPATRPIPWLTRPRRPSASWAIRCPADEQRKIQAKVNDAARGGQG